VQSFVEEVYTTAVIQSVVLPVVLLISWVLRHIW